MAGTGCLIYHRIRLVHGGRGGPAAAGALCGLMDEAAWKEWKRENGFA